MGDSSHMSWATYDLQFVALEDGVGWFEKLNGFYNSRLWAAGGGPCTGLPSDMRAYIKAVFASAIVAASAVGYGHAVGPLGGQSLGWSNEQISGVIAGGTPRYYPSRTAIIEGKECLIGNMFNFNVRDEYAFDIDETVELEVEFYLPEFNTRVFVFYDKNGTIFDSNVRWFGADVAKKIVIRAQKTHWRREQFVLDRARFANRGFSGSDLLIYGEPEAPTKGSNGHAMPEIIVCGVSLKRTYTTPRSTAYGQVIIEAVGDNEKPTPVRLGIYDKAGRLLLPNDEAIPLRNYGDVTRVISLRPGSVAWPTPDRDVFYIDGRYHTRLPAGDYELVASKGPEYQIVRERFTLKGDETQRFSLKMQRWDDLAAKGWYSGDDHIHYTRDSGYDDRNLLKFAEAEDLHVANILQMGNSGNTYFRQYAWDVVSNADDSTFVLVPGQEDPRTIRHGHTIQLHLKKPIRDPSRYLLYHEVFRQVRAQGGGSGYAHVFNEDYMASRRGMAVDMPFGLVDFAEVMQFGNVNTSTWFDFLNLGYKLAPSAGSDYPYLDVPGAVRSYVKIDSEFSAQAWLQGLKNGHSFVTNGPMLEFCINGHDMGSELHVKLGEPLVIEAKARINPSIDQLDRLELIEQGEVINAVSSQGDTHELSARYAVAAEHGTWFVLRAHGKQEREHGNVVAVSSPIYVNVNDQSFWKPSAAPAIVFKLKQDLLQPLSEQDEIETWDTHDPDSKVWKSQRPLLQARVAQAAALYDNLLQRIRDAQMMH